MIKSRPAYRNLRHFIYIHAHPQSRGEGYRLVKKLMEETREDCAKVGSEAIKKCMRSPKIEVQEKVVNVIADYVAAAIRGRG